MFIDVLGTAEVLRPAFDSSIPPIRIDERPSQRGYLVLDHLTHSDALVLEFEQHVRANLHEPLDLHDVAAVLGTSRRTLERRTQTVPG